MRMSPAFLKSASLQSVFRIIAEAGGEARVAGGAVRNALLKQKIADIDIASTLPPQRVAEAFQARGHLVIPTGIDHGTVTVKIGNSLFEITTLRRDVATDGRRATVAFTDDWQQDASRRDFTINALFLDSKGNLTDYFDGYKDIQNRRVKFVGAPSLRIREDYLRILRFFRFFAHYAKGRPDAKALAACTRARSGMRQLSAERISAELLKIIEAPRAIETLRIMDTKGILKVVLPLKHQVNAKTWRVLSRLPADAILRLSLLAPDETKLKSLLRLSNAQGARLSAARSAPILSPRLRPDEQRRLLYAVGSEGWSDAVCISWAQSGASLKDRAWKSLLTLPQRWPRPLFPVNGRDLQARNVTPGPRFSEILRDLEDWWIATNFTATREDLLNRIES